MHERSWKFFNPQAQNAEVLAKCILEQVNIVLNGDSDKLIAQTYDRAPVFSGEKGGVHKIIQQTQICTFCALLCASIKFNYRKGTIIKLLSLIHI